MLDHQLGALTCRRATPIGKARPGPRAADVRPLSQAGAMHPDQTFDDTARIFRGPARQWIWDRTVGLYFRTESGEPVMRGSGVLFKISNVAFILTAGHVLKEHQDMEIQIGAMAKGSKLLKAHGRRFGFTNDLADMDTGFIELSEEVAGELSKYKAFTRMNDIDLRTSDPCAGPYCILGFPQQINTPDYNKKEINARPLHYLSTPLPRNDEGKEGVTLLLKVTKRTVILSDPENSIEEETRAPDLQGISGCGMWRLYEAEKHAGRLDRWEPSWIRLIGIEHGWVPGKWVKGTFIRHAIDLIENSHPELQASFKLTK